MNIKYLYVCIYIIVHKVMSTKTYEVQANHTSKKTLKDHLVDVVFILEITRIIS